MDIAEGIHGGFLISLIFLRRWQSFCCLPVRLNDSRSRQKAFLTNNSPASYPVNYCHIHQPIRSIYSTYYHYNYDQPPCPTIVVTGEDTADETRIPEEQEEETTIPPVTTETEEETETAIETETETGIRMEGTMIRRGNVDDREVLKVRWSSYSLLFHSF